MSKWDEIKKRYADPVAVARQRPPGPVMVEDVLWLLPRLEQLMKAARLERCTFVHEDYLAADRLCPCGICRALRRLEKQ